MKYHPDRNPGKESECIAKFQAIQAAHEILCDAEQRQKYDVERRQRGFVSVSQTKFTPPFYGPGQSPRKSPYPSRSPYATPFPPPPPPPPRNSTYTSGASTASTTPSGASRFAHFPKPPPTAQRPSAKDDAGSRANVFTAWQYMNPGTRSQSAFAKGAQRAQTPGGVGSDPASHRRSQSAWENVRAPGLGRSNTTRAPRKNGFDPATPGADEPAVTGTAGYFTTHRREPQPSPLFREIPVSNPKQRASPDRSKSPERGPFGRRSAEDMRFTAEGISRLRTPYNSTPGERTYVTNESIRRSASTRDTAYRPSPKSGTQPDQQTPERRETRHRSASPSPNTPMSSGKTRPQPSRASPDDHNSSMSSGNNGTSSSQSPAFDLHSSSEESEEEDDSTSTDETEPSRGEFSKQWKDSSNEAAADKLDRPKAVPSSIWKMRDGRKLSDDIRAEKSGVRDGQAETPSRDENDANKFRFSPSEWNGAFTSGNDVFMNQPTGVKNGPARKGGTARPSSVRTRSSSQSAIPIQRRNQSNTGKKASVNDINEPLVAPSVPSTSQQPISPQRNEKTFTSDAPIPSGNASTSSAKFHKKPDFAPLPGEVKFSATQWAQTLKEPNWVLPPQRSSSPEKRSKTVKSKNNNGRFASMPVPKQASVSEVVDESEVDEVCLNGEIAGAGNAGSSAADLNDDENAMDIDIEPSTPAPPAPPLSRVQPTGSQTGRIIEPLSTNKYSTSKEGSTGVPGVKRSQTAAATEQSHQRPPLANPVTSNNNNTNSNTAAATDPQPNSLNLGAFERVVPFQHPPNTGLSDLDPVARTLPFDSHASTINPLKKESPLLQPHHLPPTPRAPAPPVTLLSSSSSSSVSTSTSSNKPPKVATTINSSNSRLTQSSWTAYLTGMQNYLVAWNAFNRTMLSHFSARQAAVDHHMQTGWLGAAGEPSDPEKMGFEGYMRALREDEMVRAHWNSSCERHREVLERHGRLRDRVRRGGVRIE